MNIVMNADINFTVTSSIKHQIIFANKTSASEYRLLPHPVCILISFNSESLNSSLEVMYNNLVVDRLVVKNASADPNL